MRTVSPNAIDHFYVDSRSAVIDSAGFQVANPEPSDYLLTVRSAIQSNNLWALDE